MSRCIVRRVLVESGSNKNKKAMAKKDITITISMPDVVFEVYNDSYLTGKSRVYEGRPDLIAAMQADEDEDDVGHIQRSVSSAWSKLKLALSEYLVDGGTTANNGLLDIKSTQTLSLSMPSNFNESARSTIADCIHRYLVYSSLFEWFLVTNKTDAKEYGEMANGELVLLQAALAKRVRPQRG